MAYSAINESIALDPNELLEMLAPGGDSEDDEKEEEGRDIVTALDGRFDGAIGFTDLAEHAYGLKRKRSEGIEGGENDISVPTGSVFIPPATPAGAPTPSERIKTFLRVRQVGPEVGPHSLQVDSSTRVTTTKPATQTRGPVSESFECDCVMDESVGQADVYTKTAAPLVRGLFEGRDGQVFAYGATNSGKSYSIWGSGEEDGKGIVSWALRDVYERLGREMLSTAGDNERGQTRRQPRVGVRALEIYNNKAFCLLPKGEKERRSVTVIQTHDEVIFEHLEEHFPSDFTEAQNLAAMARSRTRVNPTNLNLNSSRAHTVLMLRLHPNSSDDGRGAAVPVRGRGRESRSTKSSGLTAVAQGPELFLVDLAGSERQKRSQSNQVEAFNINLDNSDLFKKFKEMEDGATSVVCRTRTLTRVLKRMFVRPTARSSSSSSFGMNCVMIVTVNPAASEYGETQKVLSNLQLSSRVVPVEAPPRPNRGAGSRMTVEYGLDGRPIKRPKARDANGGAAGVADTAVLVASDSAVRATTLGKGEGKGKEKLSAALTTAGSRSSSSSGREVEQLQRRIEQLEDEMARLQEEHAAALDQAEIEAFRLASEESSEAAQELEREVDELRAQVRRLKAKLDSKSPVGAKVKAVMAESEMKRKAKQAESVRKLEKVTTREADAEAARQSDERARAEETLAAALAEQAVQKLRVDAAEALTTQLCDDLSVERFSKRKLEEEVARLKTAATVEADNRADLEEKLRAARREITRLENSKYAAFPESSIAAAPLPGDSRSCSVQSSPVKSGSEQGQGRSARPDCHMGRGRGSGSRNEEGEDGEALTVGMMSDFGDGGGSDGGDSPFAREKETDEDDSMEEPQRQLEVLLSSALTDSVAAENDAAVDGKDPEPAVENESPKKVLTRKSRRRVGQIEAEVVPPNRVPHARWAERKPLRDLQHADANTGHTDNVAACVKGVKQENEDVTVVVLEEEEQEKPLRTRGGAHGKKMEEQGNPHKAAEANETQHCRQMRKRERISKPSPEVVVVNREQAKNVDIASKIVAERRRRCRR